MSVSPDDSKNPKQLIRPWTAIAEMNRNIELPKTAYTLAFVLFMLQETKDQSPNCIERCLEWWGTLMQCLFTLAIHYVVLGLLTYYLVMLEYDTVPIDEAPAFLLLSTCSCVFTSFCMSDLVESFSMTHWLYEAPAAPRLMELRLCYNEDKNRREIASTMPTWAKWFLFFIVILPKIAFVGLLQVYGTKLVLFSGTNSDVLLNTLAAFFLAEIDDYVYQFLADPAMKNAIEDTEQFPPLYLDGESMCGQLGSMCGILFGPCCRVGMIIFITWIMWVMLGSNARDEFDLVQINMTNTSGI